VAVPGEIDPNKEPSANFKNGIIEVSFEKIPEEKPKEIPVKNG
jgi:HSP20 family molecular chaperone IbpA